MTQEQKGMIRTKMADAFIKGLHQCVKEGRNPKKVGRRILTANAAGVGIKYMPREKAPKVAA